MAAPRPATAVDPVAAEALAGTTSAPDLSMLGMFLHADLIGKMVIVGLLLISIWSWAIIIEKWITIRALKARTRHFENEFWGSEALDKFYERAKKRTSHPIAAVFTAGMDEWFRSKGTAAAGRASVRERVAQIMSVTRNREIEKLENGLGFLATAGSSAPFIGLFGTVWGIMHSFRSIAATQNTSIASVAPGIAEALFATAVGLFTAIPAYIAYNRYTREIGLFSGRLDDFTTEFGTILSRQVEG